MREMTELIYYNDPYIREFIARVTSVFPEERAITLDRTAFYPGGGGQPFDTGVIYWNDKKYALMKMRREGVEIKHVIEELEPKIVPGSDIRGVLDWERRHRIMRTHTAMHILCGVIWRDHHVSVTGGNMDPGKGRMDFEFENLSKEMITEIESKCNQEVEADRKITTKILPREEALRIPDLIRTKVNLIPEAVSEIRIVEIIGLDMQADGGTHVNSTADVGQIRLVDYKSKGAINKRIYLEIE